MYNIEVLKNGRSRGPKNESKLPSTQFGVQKIELVLKLICPCQLKPFCKRCGGQVDHPVQVVVGEIERSDACCYKVLHLGLCI